VAHNHPSGTTTPSAEDIRTTRRLREVLDLCGLKLRDHIIIGDA
jgi:DNA repair protein RadC